MRIATFNLENWGEGPELAQRIRILQPQLLRLNADILFLQEVDGHRKTAHAPRDVSALRRLIEGTPYSEFHLSVTRSKHKASGVLDVHNLVTLSRFPFKEGHQVLHDYVAPPAILLKDEAPIEAAWDRPFLYGCIEHDGRPLHLINVHLRAPLASYIPGGKSGPFTWNSVAHWAEGYFISSIKRSGQAFEVRRLCSELLARDPEARIAIAGDFNAELNEMPLRLLIAAEEDLGTGAFAHECLVPLSRSLPLSNRFTVVHAGRPQMLDHILVSRTLFGAFKAIEAHNEMLTDEAVAFGRINQPRGSLHAPVVAEFVKG
ncbi:MAG: endonuclease/exonuclease/phosphatase family protein [Alphaproteobacteria bacterium]|nr:endonuclease/exonuclease/phosphatase family protein [Alphaproteobacteria bacterium]